MGHRTLVAYERPNETYNLHYTHWGGCNLKLKHAITAKSPFGDTEPATTETQRVYDQLQTATDTGLSNSELSQTRTDIDIVPRAVGLTIDEAITEQFDYHLHEAFYVVSRDFEVTASRTFWLGFSSDARSVDHSPTVGNGILATVRWYDGEPVGDGYLRGWFTSAKHLLGDLIDREFFTESQAITYLVENLLAQTDNGAETVVRRPDQRPAEQ